VAASPRHNWALRDLARIVERAAVDAGSQVVVCDGGEWEISTPAGGRKPDVFVVPREAARAAITEGTQLEAEIEADKPFAVSFDPADLLDF
jgi:hypothetical protein